ncbi:MAG TPA: hypothetical protein VHM90_01070, partial [Phycisphaerae bacterium]|nr:hypothetical protein [Phycisphaerae bacterium]
MKNNPHVVDLQWTTIWTDNYWPKVEGIQPDTLYRPLTLWSYLANQAIAPGSAWQFHLVNVLLHALVSVLVAVLAARIVGKRAVAVVAGVLFAVHPLHTEVVANIVGRAELLAAVWSLLMLLIYLQPAGKSGGSPVLNTRSALLQLGLMLVPVVICLVCAAKFHPNTFIGVVNASIAGLAGGILLASGASVLLRDGKALPSIRSRWHGLLVAACFSAAILCKETPITLTLAVVLIDAYRWTKWGKGNRPSLVAWFASQGVRYYGPLALAVVCYTRARINAGGLMSRAEMIHRVVNPLVEASVPERIVTPFALLAKYISLTFWPVHLSADYSAPSLTPTANLFSGNSFQPPAIFGVLICGLLITVSVYCWKRRPEVLLLAGLTFLSYILVANFVRIGTIFGERLFYWPSVFVLILAAWALVEGHGAVAQFFAKLPTRANPVATPAFEPGAVLSYQSKPMRASRYWQQRENRISFATIALLVVVTGAMSIRTWARNPDWCDNLSLAISTARDNPDSGKACSWAGSILVAQDDPGIREFGKSLIERAVELSPDYVSARWELAKFYGIHGEIGPSAVCVAQAARLDPGTHLTRTAIPALVDDLRHTDPDKYMPYIQNYADTHPSDEAAYLALAFAYHAQGKWDKAEELAYKALHTAVSKRSDGADGFHEAGAELAAIRFDRGEVEHAVETMLKYTSNIRHSVDGHCILAQMLLSLDPKKHAEAIEQAEAHMNFAEQITPGNPHVREVRGQIGRAKTALAHGDPLPSDIPVPRVTV